MHARTALILVVTARSHPRIARGLPSGEPKLDRGSRQQRQGGGREGPRTTMQYLDSDATSSHRRRVTASSDGNTIYAAGIKHHYTVRTRTRISSSAFAFDKKQRWRGEAEDPARGGQRAPLLSMQYLRFLPPLPPRPLPELLPARHSGRRGGGERAV